MIIEFTIPGRLPSLNEFIAATKCHDRKFYKGNDMKRRCQQEISAYIPRHAKGMCIDTPCTVYFIFYEPNLKRDPDNISATAHKFVLDALVKNKVITDDSCKHIEGIQDMYKLDRKNPRIYVAVRYEDQEQGG